MKYLVLFIVCVATSHAFAKSELPNNSARLISACESTIHEYALARDLGDAERFSKLFVDDAVMLMFGNKIEGKDNIVDSMLKRAAAAPSMHMVTTVKITPIDEFRASGESYALVLVAQDEASSVAGSLRAGAKYSDQFRLVSDQCLIVSRTLDIMFDN